MDESSISKLSPLAPQSPFAAALGAAIRQRRIAQGLTQTQLGHPFTKGFVSEVERGRSLPSLRALALLAERLGVHAGELLEEVKGGLPTVYTARDENEHATPRQRGSRDSVGRDRDADRDAPEAGPTRGTIDAATARR
jgi:transcriptional regulator with XRE-family HTH domain